MMVSSVPNWCYRCGKAWPDGYRFQAHLAGSHPLPALAAILAKLRAREDTPTPEAAVGYGVTPDELVEFP